MNLRSFFYRQVLMLIFLIGKISLIYTIYNVSLVTTEQNKTKRQKAMVKESLTRAFDELHSGNAHHNARELFVEDINILG